LQILDQKLDTISLSVSKPPLTTPKGFHFATDERLGPATASVFDQFEKVCWLYFLQLKIKNSYFKFNSVPHLYIFSFFFFYHTAFSTI
jgi:hypothetical protein